MNLSPVFFLKKIATFAAAPYHRTLFADADTCMCGGHLEDMWRELDDHELIHTIDPAKNQGVGLLVTPRRRMSRVSLSVAVAVLASRATSRRHRVDIAWTSRRRGRPREVDRTAFWNGT